MTLSLALVKQKYSAYGGAEKVISSAITALQVHEDIKVSILARSWDREALAGCSNCRMIRCNPPYIGRAMRDNSFFREVSKYLQSFDLVQAHEPMPGAHIYRAGSGLHAQWLLQLTRDMPEKQKREIFEAKKNKVPIMLERKMFEHSSLKAVIAISPMVVKNIAETYPEFDQSKVKLIWNGVNHEAFSPRLRNERRHLSLARYGILGGQKVLLMLGSGWHRKGVANALLFLGRLPSNVILMVAGKESSIGRYREMAQDLGIDPVRLRWIGATSDPMELYAAADLFIFPSLYDQFGNAALEAMACGLPIVISSTAGACDLVSDGKDGFIRNWWEPYEWVEPIMTCLDNAESMGANAYAKSLSFTFGNMINNWIDLYRDVGPS